MPSRLTYRFGGLTAVTTLVASLAASQAASQFEPPPQKAAAVILSDGVTVEKVAEPGDLHRYEAALSTGDFLELLVSQDQLLVTLLVQGPDGATLHQINLPDIHPLPERLIFIAKDSGPHVVDVSVERTTAVQQDSEPKPDRSGPRTYSLQVVALRPSSPGDRARAEWFNLTAQAVQPGRLQSLDGLRQAIQLLREAAAGWRGVGDVALETTTLESLASLTAIFTEFADDSVAARVRLSALYAAQADQEQLIINWRHLGREYSEAGQLELARHASSRALELARTAGFRTLAARALRDVGVHERELANYERAREIAQQAQTLAAAIPNPALEALTMWDLALLDDVAGDVDAAIAHSERGLALDANDTGTRSIITTWLGLFHLRRGDLDQAQSRFEEGIALTRRFVQRDLDALARLGLGDVSLARGDRTSARASYEAAATALAKGIQQFRCIAEQRLGSLDLKDGRLTQARGRFDTMLEIAGRRQAAACEAVARAGLADLALAEGDLETADDEATRVVELTERFREAAVSLESRALGFGALAPAYERAVHVSMRRAERGEADALSRAFQRNEQSLARGLLDGILETRLDASARVPSALATERRVVRERWRARLAELQVAVRVRPNAPQTRKLLDESGALAVQLRDLDARIAAADARYASFVRPRPLAPDAVQALLDDDTVLLEYALGEARSYLWVVSSRGIRGVTLPPRAAIERVAGRVREELGRSPLSAGADPSTLEENLRALVRMVFEPALPLADARRLVIVPSGGLSMIPFGALPLPRDSGATTPHQRLIGRYEIVQIPSATTLGTLRSLQAGRARPSKVAAVFADPIYDADDPRVRPNPASARSPRTQPTTLALARLPFSRAEADAIIALAPAGGTLFVGADATRDRVLKRALADYRIVHFATHGVVHEKVPNLSSIVLSLVDQSGRRRDGLVMLPDVYEMTLNADLVVLSGCQTALGKEVRGEGPLGLARGFMYAGAPRVVGSLWQVNDIATAELMQRFYRGIFVQRLTPAAALRAAQRELAAIPRWAAPYYWAGFVMQGDWR